MSTLDSSFPLYASKEIGYPWHPTALVIVILGKMHSFSSLINEIGKWSLFELLPANLSKPPCLMLLQGVFIIANENMKKLVFLLKNSNSSSEVIDMFEMMYENGSAHFADLTRLLLQIKDEVLRNSTWSTSSNFEERVLKRFAISGRVNRLIIKVDEFNESIDRLKELLKEKDENNEKEEGEGEGRGGGKVKGEGKDGDDEEYKEAQKMWEKLEKYQRTK